MVQNGPQKFYKIFKNSHGIFGATTVGKMIFCQQLACPGVPLASKHIWEDDQAWESGSHAISGATTVGNMITGHAQGLPCHQNTSGRMIKCGKNIPLPHLG